MLRNPKRSCLIPFVLFDVVRLYSFFFFFQAEDGIRDLTVTGVQTCALPILDLDPCHAPLEELPAGVARIEVYNKIDLMPGFLPPEGALTVSAKTGEGVERLRKIGRASCRERVESSVVAVSLKEKARKRVGIR